MPPLIPLLLSLLLSLLTLATALHPTVHQNQSPSPTPNTTCPIILSPRIVGGVPATAFAPYLAALFDATGKYQCSGVLLDKRWLITAAHCAPHKKWTARLGGALAHEGKRYSLSFVATHPQFVPGTFEKDLAAIKLRGVAPASSKFAVVNKDRRLPRPGAYAKAVGYGSTRDGEEVVEGRRRLRSVDVEVVPRRECKRLYRGLNGISDSMVCAGRGGCDACQGDSGGPLLQFGEEVVVVGVVSFGKGCADEGFPGVYADVRRLRGWLRRVGVRFGGGRGEQVFAV